MHEYEVFYSQDGCWRALRKGYNGFALLFGPWHALFEGRFKLFFLLNLGHFVIFTVLFALLTTFLPMSVSYSLLPISPFLVNHIYALRSNENLRKKMQLGLVASNISARSESDAINSVMGDRRNKMFTEFVKRYGHEPSKKEMDVGMWSGMFIEPPKDTR